MFTFRKNYLQIKNMHAYYDNGSNARMLSIQRQYSHMLTLYMHKLLPCVDAFDSHFAKLAIPRAI